MLLLVINEMSAHHFPINSAENWVMQVYEPRHEKTNSVVSEQVRAVQAQRVARGLRTRRIVLSVQRKQRS